MPKILWTLAIAALPNLGWAGDWQYLTEDKASNALYIDPTSILTVGKVKKAWFKEVMHELTPVPGSLSSYKFELVLTHIDCAAKTIGYAQVIMYGEDEETILRTLSDRVKSEDMLDPIPHSLGARMVDAVCSPSKRRR
jgi:hypothetical protein